MKSMKIFMIAVTVGLLAACASFTAAQTNASTVALEQVAIEAATTAVIQSGGNTPAEFKAKAQQIKTIADIVKAAGAGQATTIASLEVLVNAQISKLNLTPQQGIVAQSLVTLGISFLQQKVGAGVLNANTLVYVNDVVAWVDDACALYGAV